MRVCVPACLGTRACARAIARLEHRSLSNREPRRCHTRHLVRQQRVWRTRASYLQAPHTVVHPDAHCGCLLPAVGQPQLSNVDSNSGCVLEMEGEGAAQTAGEQQCQQQVQKGQGRHLIWAYNPTRQLSKLRRFKHGASAGMKAVHGGQAGERDGGRNGDR